jgi:hypothetical protein
MSMAKRQRSTIAFPYSDLADAEKVASIVHESHGGSCELDQLAPDLGHDTTNSGAFRSRLSGAALFGVINSDRGSVTLTRLGERIVEPNTRERARIDAFLSVPLYKAVYDSFRGRMLPADQGLESFMEQQGVAPKQTAKARQAFQRSASHAGFFHAGKDRLVEPSVRQSSSTTVSQAPKASLKEDENVATRARADTFTFTDPLIEGLFRRLPGQDEPFPHSQQQTWIELAQKILETVWDEDTTVARTNEDPHATTREEGPHPT